jgi:VanZ family protein
MPDPYRDARPRRIGRGIAWALLVIYAVIVVLIAFWPVPVDRDAAGFLTRLGQIFPWATYRRVEFAANVAFFAPLGLLLGILLDRARYLVVPIALVVTVTIEGIQGELLAQRTATIDDVLANVIGACIGLIVAAMITGVSDRVRRTRSDL